VPHCQPNRGILYDTDAGTPAWGGVGGTSVRCYGGTAAAGGWRWWPAATGCGGGAVRPWGEKKEKKR
jgi:hypothetical protein